MQWTTGFWWFQCLQATKEGSSACSKATDFFQYLGSFLNIWLLEVKFTFIFVCVTSSLIPAPYSTSLHWTFYQYWWATFTCECKHIALKSLSSFYICKLTRPPLLLWNWAVSFYVWGYCVLPLLCLPIMILSLPFENKRYGRTEEANHRILSSVWKFDRSRKIGPQRSRWIL
jgi:hypothetical protein